MRLHIFATHPVQYHVPLWRALANHRELDVKVFYFSDHSVRGGLDRDFGLNIAWDVDLLAGYEHQFVTRDAPLDQHRAVRIPHVNDLLANEKPNWVMIAGYTHAFELQLLRAARRRSIPVLMRGEFSDLSYGVRPLPKRMVRALYLRWFYAQVERFCFIGKGAKQHLLDHGVRESQLFFSPYSVDDRMFEQQRGELTREQARAELGIPADQFVFLLSGKLIERKNPFAVLRAIERLRDNRRATLIALGDGVLKSGFVAEARALLGDRFVFPGFVNQSQLGRYFVASDALVIPSHHETWGLVVNEAMHYGLPVVASSQVGCAPDLVIPGRTGFVYEANDIGKLAEAMQHLMDDPQLSRQLGAAGYDLVSGYKIECSARGVFEALGLGLPAPGRAPSLLGSTVTS